MRTKSSEDYLKAIYQLSTGDNHNVSTKAVSDYLDVKPASSTEMFQRLDEHGYIKYTRYRGVTLLKKGRVIAINMVRKHRLWETFLVDKLEFQWDQVHEIAEQLEHIVSPDLVDRLDRFLDYPKTDPHGDPIPDENGKVRQQNHSTLSSIEPGTTVTVVGVADDGAGFFSVLQEHSIDLGVRIQVLKVFDYDGSILVKINGKDSILSNTIGKNLRVSAH